MVYRSGMDSVVRGHWTSYLQMVLRNIFEELKNLRYIYIYSAELVLSTELSQAVTKKLVTNALTFNL